MGGQLRVARIVVQAISGVLDEANDTNDTFLRRTGAHWSRCRLRTPPWLAPSPAETTSVPTTTRGTTSTIWATSSSGWIRKGGSRDASTDSETSVRHDEDAPNRGGVHER